LNTQNIVEKMKQHPTLTIAGVVVAIIIILVVARSLSKKQATPAATGAPQ
jgi:hypothetical protein